MARFSFFVMLLSLTVTAPAFAQGVSSGEEHGAAVTGAVLKNRAPGSKEVLEIKFPRPREVTLDNGLQIMVLEDHFLPKISIQIMIPHGSLQDPEDMPGLASITADLLSEGAGGHSSVEISNMLDDMGASFYSSADFGYDDTTLFISGLSEFNDRLVTLLADLTLRPLFSAEELEKYRAREMASLVQQRTQPRFLSNERFMAALYPNHPAQVVAPSENTLKSVSVEDLKGFHQSYYLPNGTIMAVAGDVVMDDIVKRLTAAFGSWKSGNAPERTLAAPEASTVRKIYLVDRPDSVQTVLKLGNVGIKRTDPDYVYVNVLNEVLGDDASSRLFLKLREEKGYTYGAYSSFETGPFAGPWDAHADVRTEVTGEALTDFIAELQKLIDIPVPEGELENAKRAIVARFALSLERSRSLCGRALELQYYGLPADYWDTYPQAVSAVTAGDIQRVAAKYLDPSRLQIVAVGDGSRILEVLEKFGPVERFDAEGNRIE